MMTNIYLHPASIRSPAKVARIEESLGRFAERVLLDNGNYAVALYKRKVLPMPVPAPGSLVNINPETFLDNFENWTSFDVEISDD